MRFLPKPTACHSKSRSIGKYQMRFIAAAAQILTVMGARARSVHKACTHKAHLRTTREYFKRLRIFRDNFDSALQAPDVATSL